MLKPVPGGEAFFHQFAANNPFHFLDLLKSLTPLKKHPHKIAFFNYQNYLSDVNLVATALEVEIEE
ncbi:hypothetical protein, partial [Escherichia coli]|uniref:hypothetical protein n=1 Tax=Escherichia coli TaxID=562 RepID=UPI003EDE7D4F